MSFLDRSDVSRWYPCTCRPFNGKLVQYEITGSEKRFGLRCDKCGKVNGSKPIAVVNLSPVERQEAAKRLLNLAESRLAIETAEDEHRFQVTDNRRMATADWWAKYDAYLLTPAWREKRAKVLERDEYKCQACRERRAVQVHHLTYRHVFMEPLFDLVAVCVTCHELITAIERRQIPREAA